MKFLIVNDDGIHAPGIAMLAQAATQFGEVVVVAPAAQCSAMSQKLTLRETMTLEKVEDFPAKVQGAYRLAGTPVDCVKVALEHILEEKPDWVLSGINNGYNVGYDIAYSGTVGAAFEARRNAVPAMAFSIAGDSHLERSRPHLDAVLRELLETAPPADAVWNVNFPAFGTKPFGGILRDRPTASVSLYREKYIAQIQPDGTAVLTCKGIPTPDDQIPEGSDAQAVRMGCISIGKVECAGR